jgi:hypothetical protein
MIDAVEKAGCSILFPFSSPFFFHPFCLDGRRLG